MEGAPWSNSGLDTYCKNPSVWTHCLGGRITYIPKWRTLVMFCSNLSLPFVSWLPGFNISSSTDSFRRTNLPLIQKFWPGFRSPASLCFYCCQFDNSDSDSKGRLNAAKIRLGESRPYKHQKKVAVLLYIFRYYTINKYYIHISSYQPMFLSSFFSWSFPCS